MSPCSFQTWADPVSFLEGMPSSEENSNFIDETENWVMLYCNNSATISINVGKIKSMAADIFFVHILWHTISSKY